MVTSPRPAIMAAAQCAPLSKYWFINPHRLGQIVSPVFAAAVFTKTNRFIWGPEGLSIAVRTFLERDKVWRGSSRLKKRDGYVFKIWESWSLWWPAPIQTLYSTFTYWPVWGVKMRRIRDQTNTEIWIKSTGRLQVRTSDVTRTTKDQFRRLNQLDHELA